MMYGDQQQHQQQQQQQQPQQQQQLLPPQQHQLLPPQQHQQQQLLPPQQHQQQHLLPPPQRHPQQQLLPPPQHQPQQQLLAPPQQQLLPPPQQHLQYGVNFHSGPPPSMRPPSMPNMNPAEYSHNQVPPYDAHGDNFGAKRVRKLVQRKAVDYTSTVVRYMQIRMWQRDSRDRTVVQPTPAAAIDMLPTAAYADNPSTSYAAKFVHASTNKNRCSINRVLWTPSGRRLITGSQSGEFTLWNGQSFNFEMILQAHDQAIRSMIWSHNDNWMVTGDDGGAIKYWQTNMNNVKANKSAHKESVRDLSFCRTDLKFCSCSDDTTVKVWDFARLQEERSLSGHGWDVKSVDWHPTKSLLVSGGKDNLVKLWDTKSGRELSSFHGHKNTVLCVKWNENGNWVLTASKDQIIKLYDIRAMKELQSFRGHSKDVTALAWHPFHEEYFVSGSYDGSIFHWLVGHEDPQVEVVGAHENSVWDLAWHPIGYILCSGSNDHTTRFWSRNRPGDPPLTKLNIGYNQGYGEHNPAFVGRAMSNFPGPETPTTPGPFATGLNRNEGTIPGIGVAMPLPNDPSDQGEQKQSLPGGAPPLPPGPHPSLLASSHQQTYQQSPQHFPQHHQQQMSSLSLPPSNFSQLQPPPHLPPLPHPHLPRPPALQLSPFQSSIPMPSSVAFPMPGTLGMQGSVNQMVPPLPQGHIMGMNPMHSSNNLQPPSSGFGNGMPSMQGGATGAQMYPANGAFNRGQPGQFPGLNTYQSGNPSGAGMGSLGPNMGHPPGLPPPPPPPPQQHQQQQPHG